jgi:hypothetical protein
MTPPPLLRLALALGLLPALAASALAGTGADQAVGPVLLAKGAYWAGFYDFWVGRLLRQDGIVMIALAVGAASLFIITRGWKRK